MRNKVPNQSLSVFEPRVISFWSTIYGKKTFNSLYINAALCIILFNILSNHENSKKIKKIIAARAKFSTIFTDYHSKNY